MTIVMIVDMILTLWSPNQLVLLLWDMLQAEMLSIVNFTLHQVIEYHLTFAMISTDKEFILLLINRLPNFLCIINNGFNYKELYYKIFQNSVFGMKPH